MKMIFAATIFLSFTLTIFGQQKSGTEPFILKGKDLSSRKIDNKVRIEYTDQFNNLRYDTTHLDENGNFYFETYNIVKPVLISIYCNVSRYLNIAAAPGYALTFIKPEIGLNAYTITGEGSEATKYYKILEAIPNSNYNSIQSWTLSEADFMIQLNKILSVRDSVAHVVFDQNPLKDKNLDYFGKMARLDNKFAKLQALFAYAGYHKYNYEMTISFVKNNFDALFFKDMSNEGNLISPIYRQVIGNFSPNSFLNYLLFMDHPKEMTYDIHKLSETLKIERVNALFTGEVRSYILSQIIILSDWKYRSLEEFKKYKDHFQSTISTLTVTARKALDEEFARRERKLTKTEDEAASKEAEKAKTFIGKPAPTFVLRSNTDQTYDLNDFKGKVVLLNLWSSWSDLCRDENRKLNKLYQKYRKDMRVAFISIAVVSDINEWKGVINEDKPDCLQLFDVNSVVSKAYIEEHVPKFILIDKQGNVVNFMAPKPSKGDDLEKLIKLELEKK